MILNPASTVLSQPIFMPSIRVILSGAHRRTFPANSLMGAESKEREMLQE